MMDLIDLVQTWPEDRVDDYLASLRTRCDNDEKFEDVFFENYFEDLCEALGTERVCRAFNVTIPNCDCGEEPEEKCGDCEEAPDLPGTVVKEDNAVYHYDTENDEVIVETAWPVRKFNVVGNSPADLGIKYDVSQGLLKISTTKRDPFSEVFVTYLVRLPEGINPDTVSVFVDGGVAHVDFCYYESGFIRSIEAQSL